MDKYKAVSYGLWRMVKDAKRRYRDKVEAQMEQRDTKCLWQGLRTITDYPGKNPCAWNLSRCQTLLIFPLFPSLCPWRCVAAVVVARSYYLRGPFNFNVKSIQEPLL